MAASRACATISLVGRGELLSASEANVALDWIVGVDLEVLHQRVDAADQIRRHWRHPIRIAFEITR